MNSHIIYIACTILNSLGFLSLLYLYAIMDHNIGFGLLDLVVMFFLMIVFFISVIFWRKINKSKSSLLRTSLSLLLLFNFIFELKLILSPGYA